MSFNRKIFNDRARIVEFLLGIYLVRKGFAAIQNSLITSQAVLFFGEGCGV